MAVTPRSGRWYHYGVPRAEVGLQQVLRETAAFTRLDTVVCKINRPTSIGWVDRGQAVLAYLARRATQSHIVTPVLQRVEACSEPCRTTRHLLVGGVTCWKKELVRS